MNRKLITSLVEIGLSENEAAIYLAAVSAGPTTIQKLASAASIKRTTAYSVVEALKKRLLMREEIRGFKKLLVAEPPSKLESILEQRKEQLRKHLPELSALYNLTPGEDSIRFYEGVEATKEVYEGILEDIRPKDEYMVISAMSPWYNLDPVFFEDFTRRRGELSRKLGFRIRLLLQDTPITRKHKRIEVNYSETIKILPPTVSLTTNLVIVPTKVVIHQLVEPIHAMVIHNPNVIRMHRELFELMWSSLPE